MIHFVKCGTCFSFFIISCLTSTLVFAEGDNEQFVGPGGKEYLYTCGPCHASTTTGYGAFRLQQRLGKEKALLHERDDLTAEVIRVAVRNGIGAMPALSQVEVNDRQLESIIGFLTKKNNRILFDEKENITKRRVSSRGFRSGPCQGRCINDGF